MKKRISYILATIIFVLQLCGCGTDEEGLESAPDTEEVQSTGASEEQKDPSESDAGSIWSLVGKDNSLDAYSWVVNALLQVEEPAEAIGGGGKKFFWETPELIILKNTFLRMWSCAGTSFQF